MTFVSSFVCKRFLGTLVSANNFGSRFLQRIGQEYVMAAKAKAKAKTKRTKIVKAEAERKTQKKTIAASPGNPDAGHKYVLHA